MHVHLCFLCGIAVLPHMLRFPAPLSTQLQGNVIALKFQKHETLELHPLLLSASFGTVPRYKELARGVKCLVRVAEG